MPDDDQSEIDIDELVEQCLQRHRLGESVDVEEIAAAHPAIEEEVREVLPALLMLEQLKPNSTERAELRKEKGPPQQVVPELEDYEVLHEIARGGMGIVYKARQKSLDRIVALKILPSAFAGDETSKKRFQNEAKSAANLHHSNIVPVFETGEENGTFFYAMQFIEGQGLDRVTHDVGQLLSGQSIVSPSKGVLDLLANSLIRGDVVGEENSNDTHNSAFSSATIRARENRSSAHTESSSVTIGNVRKYFRSVAKIGVRVADALAYAHRQGVIHRDIKPSNLLLDTNGVVWVADFGLAKTGDDGLTHTGDVVGTIRYMAPERFDGHCDEKSDIYALGITLHEMLAMQPAFQATGRLKLLASIRNSEPESLGSIDSRIPSDLQTIVAKSIDKDPHRRYSSAQAMADDLQRFLDGRPIEARRVSTPERILIWAKRNPVTALLVSLLMAMVLATSIGSTIAAFRFRAIATENVSLAAQKTAESKEATKQRDAARTNAYFADMRSANQDWLDGQVRRMLTTLRRYVPVDDGQADIRGWEWYYLLSLVNHQHQTIVTEGTTQLRWTSDEQYLVSAGNEVLHFRDPDGVTVRQLSIPGLRRFALSPNGDRVVTVAEGSNLSVWDIHTGEQLQEIPTEIESIADVDWDPQGDRICYASKDDPRIRILTLSSGEVASVPGQSAKPRKRLRFSPDGKYLAVCNRERQAEIFDVENQTWIKHQSPLRSDAVCVAWHPNSRQFAEATADHGLLMFEFVEETEFAGDDVPTTDRLVTNFNVGDEARKGRSMTDVRFSKDGGYLTACGRSNRVDVYDVQSKKLRWMFRGHLDATVAAVWHPSKSQVVSASLDGAIKFWELPFLNPHRKQLIGRNESRNSSGISRDGRWKWQRVSTRRTDGAFDMTIIVLDNKTGLEVGRIELPPYTTWSYTPIFFSSGKRMLVTQAYHHGAAPNAQWLERDAGHGNVGNVFVFDTDSWQEIDAYEPAGVTGPGRPNYALRGDRFVTTDKRGYLRIFDASKNADTWIRAHRDALLLTMNPAGTRLATCSAGKVTIWDTVSWTEIASYLGHDPNSELRSVMWGKHGKYLVTGSSDGTAFVWDTNSHSRLHTLHGHPASVSVIGFSPDNARVLTRSENVYVWDVSSGRELFACPFGGNGDLVDFEFLEAIKRVQEMTDVASQFDSLDRTTSNAAAQSRLKSARSLRLDSLARALLHPSDLGYDPSRALKLARQATELAPAEVGYGITLAWAQYRSGDVSGARETLQRIASEDEPANPRSLLLLALCEFQSGNADAAREAFKLATSTMTPATMDTDLRKFRLEAAKLLFRKPNSVNSRIVVTTLDDEIDGVADGSVSLREAIIMSEPGDRIEFELNGDSRELRLRMGPIGIVHDIEIVGPGHENLTLDGLANSRVFEIDDGMDTKRSTVQISGLRFTRGTKLRHWDSGGSSASVPEEAGGAIFAKENLTIKNCAFEENGYSVWKGGAICAGFGTNVSIENSTFSKNAAEAVGAVWLVEASQAVFESCTFAGNEADSIAALDLSGAVELRNCTFANNKSSQGSAVLYRGTDCRISHCKFESNTTGAEGSFAIEPDASADSTKMRFEITHCVMSGNQTDQGQPLDLHLPENSQTQVAVTDNVIGVLSGESVDDSNRVGSVDE